MGTEEFKKIRNFLMKEGHISKKCREVSPYYYEKNNPKGERKRAPGYVARFLYRMMGKQSPDLYPPEKRGEFLPTCSWCGDYRRTKSSIKIEHEGEMNFWNLLAPFAESMMEKSKESEETNL